MGVQRCHEQAPAVVVPHALLAYTRDDLAVFYSVEVTVGGTTLKAYKRYSDIERLHRALLGLCASTGVGTRAVNPIDLRLSGVPWPPPFPSKNIFLIFSWTNSSFRRIEERRCALETYMQEIVPRLAGTPGWDLLHDFFTSDSVDQLMATEQGQEVPRSLYESTWMRRGYSSAPKRRVLVALPWAREEDSSVGHSVRVKSARNEPRRVAYRRFLEFNAMLEWLATVGDQVPSAHEAMYFIANRRANMDTGREELRSPHRKRLSKTVHQEMLGEVSVVYGSLAGDFTISVTPPASVTVEDGSDSDASDESSDTLPTLPSSPDDDACHGSDEESPCRRSAIQASSQGTLPPRWGGYQEECAC